jgi:protein phosphatase slingshot
MEGDKVEECPAPQGASENELRLLQQVRIILALKHAKTDGQPSEIYSHLYLGSIGAAMNKNNLSRLGITHVLCVADNIKPQFPNLFTYKSIEILDTANSDVLAILPQCFEFIDQVADQGGKVLLHCFAGKSRSASVCIAYVMKSQRLSLLDAFRYVRERRNAALPNTGFMRQLKVFESELGIVREEVKDEKMEGVELGEGGEALINERN